ncbi:hypothetical protein GQX74_014553 [Glossina fuscipes]|nr:hypothetical protein GQX74_014553 [Glossina fuscipes]
MQNAYFNNINTLFFVIDTQEAWIFYWRLNMPTNNNELCKVLSAPKSPKGEYSATCFLCVNGSFNHHMCPIIDLRKALACVTNYSLNWVLKIDQLILYSFAAVNSLSAKAFLMNTYLFTRIEKIKNFQISNEPAQLVGGNYFFVALKGSPPLAGPVEVKPQDHYQLSFQKSLLTAYLDYLAEFEGN